MTIEHIEPTPALPPMRCCYPTCDQLADWRLGAPYLGSVLACGEHLHSLASLLATPCE